MNILVIDPWCSDDYEVYTIGFVEGLANYEQVTLVSAYNENRYSKKYNLVPIFFKYSNSLSRGSFRKIIRGVEYIYGYMKIFDLIKKSKYDVIHIQWLLNYKLDKLFLKYINKIFNGKVIFTSHNVLPHINGTKYINQLKSIHKEFDNIILHGESIKKEYLDYFPEDELRLYIQKHGVHLTQTTAYDKKLVPLKVEKIVSEYKRNLNSKIIVFVGYIFYNKGVDRILKHWLRKYANSENLLIIAGELTEYYKELNEIKREVESCNNILYYPKRTSDDLFSYLVSSADCLVTPYRHASMSGIVFTAAAFNKPLLYTDVGTISEYVKNDKYCYVAKNSDIDLNHVFDIVMCEDLSVLNKRGERFHNYIYKEYDWRVICKRLIYEIYKK